MTEPAQTFRKKPWTVSACSSTTNCVQVQRGLAGAVQVCDSKNPQCPVLDLTRQEWAAVVAAIRDGGQPRGVYRVLPGGDVDWSHGGVTLTFSDAEWAAFCDGVASGKFGHGEPGETSGHQPWGAC